MSSSEQNQSIFHYLEKVPGLLLLGLLGVSGILTVVTNVEAIRNIGLAMMYLFTFLQAYREFRAYKIVSEIVSLNSKLLPDFPRAAALFRVIVPIMVFGLFFVMVFFKIFVGPNAVGWYSYLYLLFIGSIVFLTRPYVLSKPGSPVHSKSRIVTETDSFGALRALLKNLR